MRSGGRILWNAIAICQMSKTSWQTGKLLGDKVLPGILQGYVLIAGEFGKEIF